MQNTFLWGLLVTTNRETSKDMLIYNSPETTIQKDLQWECQYVYWKFTYMTYFPSIFSRLCHGQTRLLAVDEVFFKAPSKVGDRIVIRSAVTNTFERRYRFYELLYQAYFCLQISWRSKDL